MAQPIQQVALRAPGFQGINTELSPINGDPEFALVADNVVVDQIGRLTNRKAFADYKNVDDAIPIVIETGPSSELGLYPPSKVITASTNYWGVHFDMGDDLETKFLWTNPREMRIEIDELDSFVVGADPGSTVVSLTIELDKNTRLITGPLPPELGPDDGNFEAPRYIGDFEISQNGNLLHNFKLDNCTLRGQSDDGNGNPTWVFLPQKGIYNYTVETSDFVNPIIIKWVPQISMLPYYPSWLNSELYIKDFKMMGKTKGALTEIIKLGKDIIGTSEVQEQGDYRPIMIYRSSEEVSYPVDQRMVPRGMRKNKAVKFGLPELAGDISYAVMTYDSKSNDLLALSLPADYSNEVLLTGQFVNFNAEDLTAGNDRLLLFVKGKQFLRLDNDIDFNAVDANWTDGAGNQYPIDGDIAISAYGRVWVTGVGGDYHQIHYSALLDETTWYTEDPNAEVDFNDAGIIDVREYWPVDGDSIVNIHAHNGFLIVFGRNSILVYANADSGTPAGVLGQAGSGIFLQDTISNVGLVRRDALCNIGTDVLFVDDSGVRSLGRVIQEKSTPIQEPSLNIRRELQEVIKKELQGSVSLSAVKLEYLPSESLAVLLFSSLKIAYAFHLATPSKTGGMKVTRWTDCFWNDAIELTQAQEDIIFLAGKPTKGLLKYKDYLTGTSEGEITPYIMRYESMALAIGSSPMQTIIPKSINFVCMGEYVPGQANALWGFSDRLIANQEFLIKVSGGSTYNVNQFDKEGDAELAGRYRDGDIRYEGYKINTTGSGELFRVGFEVKVQGGRYALQEINVNTAVGRLRA